MENKRFRIEFSGKKYPEYRPTALTILAPSEERAKQWARTQLELWHISSSDRVRVVVTEVLIEPEKQEETSDPKGS